jgi:putative FmdB family regulatory protein
MIYWYYCNSCMKEFSHVFVGGNDAKRCPKCQSTDIKHIIRRHKTKGVYF